MGRFLSSLPRTVGVSLFGAAAGAMLWGACSQSDSGGIGTTAGAGGATGSTTGSTTSTTGTTTSTTTGATTTTGAGGTNGGGGAGGSTGGGGGTGGGSANVLQFHKNLSRDGLYVDAAFTKANAARIHRDTTFTAAIQGPTFMVEYDNTQNDSNHIHSVWRTFAGDWGEDILAAHYAANHG